MDRFAAECAFPDFITILKLRSAERTEDDCLIEPTHSLRRLRKTDR
jgi:hypothetical protein